MGSERIFSDLIQRSGQIPTPSDYYFGLPVGEYSLPENILIFARDYLSRSARVNNQHHRCMLIINLHSRGYLCVDEQVLCLEEGEGVLVFPYQLHHYITVGKEIKWVFVTFETANPDVYNALRNRTVSLSMPVLENLNSLLQLYTHAAGEEAESNTQIALRLALLLEEMKGIEPVLENSGRNQLDEMSRDMEIVDRVNKYVYQNLERPLTVDEVAYHAGVSSSHLRWVFRQAMAVSLGEYIRRVKLNQAAGMLNQTARSVGEISELCGFSSPSVFSSTFKQYMGVPPKKFRQRNKNLTQRV